MSINKKYFSTGEFARIFKINKKTLFYYDEIGLFKPEKVDYNGYRYYSEYQIDLFAVIYTLKEIGMPLKEIKNLLDNKNPEVILDLFENKYKEIEEEINNLKKKQEILSNKIGLINESKNFHNDIKIENQNEEYLIVSKQVSISHESYDLNCYIEHIDYCYKNNLYIGYPPGTIVTRDNILKNKYYNYDYYYTKVNKNELNKNIVVKPKGKYLVGYIKGYYDKTPILYEKLLKFIKDNNMIVTGDSYSEVIFDEVVNKNNDDFILKVSIKVD